MRALDFPERAAPGASLILDFDIHAATVAHVDADDGNMPPGRPLALCAHALAASSLTSRTASSAAGCPSRKRATKARAYRT